MIHQTLVVGPFQCNCTLLVCEKTLEAVLIDPGDEPEKILKEIGLQSAKIKFILHTHAHLDHIGATEAVRNKIEAPTCLHPDDKQLYENLPMQGKMFGLSYTRPPDIEKFIQDEEILSFGEHSLETLHTPGHSPGSVCFRLRDGNEPLFSGDTLFQQSIGRTDLWGGNTEQLLTSIKTRLLTLKDDIQVFPGHGPSTLIGKERRYNPFLS